MDINIFSVSQFVWQAFAASGVFHYIKIIASFIIAILLIADILLISKRVRGDIKIAFYGAKVPSLKKSKYVQRWESIKGHLTEGSVSSAKVAVIEADKMLGETLEKIGHKGQDTGERIATIKPGQMIGIEEAGESHEIFKKIVQDPAYEISLDEIRSVLDGYEKVFRGLELLD